MRYFLMCIGMCLCSTLFAATPRTEHTFGLSEGEQRPAASLKDAEWLIGSWEGTAFGKQFEAVWSPPSAATMVGTFKLFDDSGIDFYEILVLEIQEGALSLKVKHFSAAFHAWEDKQDYVNFRLVAKKDNELHFSGISFYRRSANSIDGYIVMRNGDKLSEHHLDYKRLHPKHVYE
ncbi:MAG: DUF6265 family protein [Pseudomonadota bacterium]